MGHNESSVKEKIYSTEYLHKKIEGAVKMAQWLRALTALPEVLRSNCGNHMVAHNHL